MDEHLRRPNSRRTFRSRECRHDRATARHSCPSRYLDQRARHRAEPRCMCLRVLEPIESKAIACEPFAEISAVDRTSRDGAAIWVETERDTVDGAPRNVSAEVVRRLGATAILRAVLATA
jgi:hypothetical protein